MFCSTTPGPSVLFAQIIYLQYLIEILLTELYGSLKS
jgi:hypothetical protein